VNDPVGAFAATPKTTAVLAPAATVKGLAGLELTLAGSALSVTWTAFAKPLTGFMEILTAELAEPCGTEIEFEDRLREKSGTGGGG